MKVFISAFCLANIIIGCNSNQKEKVVAGNSPPKYDLQSDTSVSAGEMKRYWLVLLKKGPNRTQDSISAAKIQAAHIANIERLGREGKLVMAGPMGIEDDLRGIFILNCKDSAEVEMLVKTDTAVKTGRLIMKYYPWWTMKGKYLFK